MSVSDPRPAVDGALPEAAAGPGLQDGHADEEEPEARQQQPAEPGTAPDMPSGSAMSAPATT
jgi:hypothetical protein